MDKIPDPCVTWPWAGIVICLADWYKSFTAIKNVVTSQKRMLSFSLSPLTNAPKPNGQILFNSSHIIATFRFGVRIITRIP